MKRLAVALLVLTFFVAPLPAWTQPAARPARLGILCGTVCSGLLFDVLRERLREHGWVEGQTLVIETRAAGGRHDLLPSLAAELVRLPVDLIYAADAATVLPAKRATDTIPIVFYGISDPVKSGIVASLARPGGNVTGLTIAVSWEYQQKLLQLIKEALPATIRVGLLWDLPGEQPPWWPELLAAARKLQLDVLPPAVARAFHELEPAIESLARQGAHVVLVPAGSATYVRAGFVPADRRLHRSDPAGRQARRPAGRAADEVR